MTECLYNVVTVLTCALTVCASWFALQIIFEVRFKIVELISRIPAIDFAVPIAAAVAMFFLFSREVPKHIEVVDCRTGKRVEQVAFNSDVICIFKRKS